MCEKRKDNCNTSPVPAAQPILAWGQPGSQFSSGQAGLQRPHVDVAPLPPLEDTQSAKCQEAWTKFPSQASLATRRESADDPSGHETCRNCGKLWWHLGLRVASLLRRLGNCFSE